MDGRCGRFAELISKNGHFGWVACAAHFGHVARFAEITRKPGK